MAMHPRMPPVIDQLRVILVKGDGTTVYDSKDDPTRKQANFVLDEEPLKFCLDCGGPTVAIIYVCKDCGKRYIKQKEAVSGKRLIVALDEKEMPETRLET
jgi:hypothetical protein